MKRISARAVKMVLRNQGGFNDEHVNDLAAAMVQVDRNLTKQRGRKIQHGRTTRTPIKKGTATRKSGIVVPIRGRK